jgi:hypothetical protein
MTPWWSEREEAIERGRPKGPQDPLAPEPLEPDYPDDEEYDEGAHDGPDARWDATLPAATPKGTET